MQGFPALKYQVQEAIYDTNSHLDEDNFYNQRQGKPAELTRTMVYIMGDYMKNYPLAFQTLGGSKVDPTNTNTTQEISDYTYTYPVMGRMYRTSKVGYNPYQAGDKPGIGHSKFKIYFRDNLIKRFYVIESRLGTQAYVLEELTKRADGYWEANCQLHAASETSYCPLSELEVGTDWIGLHTAVPQSQSRGTTTNSVLPGAYKNQMGIIRQSLSWAGNAANKIMKIKMKTENGETDVWMDWFMWQFEQAWVRQIENMAWYSRYNGTQNGEIMLKDILTGKPISTGSGVLEQIQNKSTYASLTYNSLTNTIGDTLFGMNDTAGMTVTLYGGMGARREVDRILKAQGAVLLNGFNGNVADKFVTGSGSNLTLGGFFDSMYHIDGYFIKFKHNPVFDSGEVALKSPKHPESGLPLESYRLVALDDADYDGRPNLTAVTEKGRSFMHGVEKGLTPVPKSLQMLANANAMQTSNVISTEQDTSAYHRWQSFGIQMMRANRSFDLQCVAGL